MYHPAFRRLKPAPDSNLFLVPSSNDGVTALEDGLKTTPRTPLISVVTLVHCNKK